MSLDREYETSKIGITRRFTLAANVTTRVRLADMVGGTNKRKRAFAFTVSATVFARQGDQTVTVSQTSTDADFGMQLTTAFRWRCDVDTARDAYVALNSSTGQMTVDITRISDTDTDDAPQAA